MIALLIAAAAAAPPACPRAAIVPGFEGWAGHGAPVLAIGRPADLRLAPGDAVDFSPPPARPPAPGSKGGVFALKIEKAGTYAIALSAKAWIDVTDGKARETATDHAHGPACSGIAKIVGFRLTPNDYVVQISGVATPTIRAMAIAR